MRTTYTIQMAIEQVAEMLRERGDQSPTTIRCAINDTLDAADEDGYKVRFDYDQDKAVRAVQRQLRD